MRRTSARLTQLRQHLDRVKWRDKQAADTYRTLILAQKPNRYSIGQFDAVLKEYYSSDFAKTVASETNAFMSFIKKQHSHTMFHIADPAVLEFRIADDRVPPDRAYVVPWEGLSKYVPATDPAKPEEAMDTFEDRVVREIPEKITSYAPPNEAYREGWERTFGESTEAAQDAPLPKKCTGYYDDGVMPTQCRNREGCGLEGCPAADFGNTFDNPSVPVPVEPKPCAGCDEVHCECDEHDPDCEKLCTQGSNCNCRRAGLI